MIGDRVVGVLDVQHDRRGGLARSDAELLQSIANQVGIALQNAQLYEKAQGSADREALLNVINQKIQKAASVEEVLEVAARELGQALGKRRAIVQLSLPNETTNGRRPLRQQQSAGRGSPNGQPSERNSLEHRGGR
jgi:GAF domain-containing protein